MRNDNVQGDNSYYGDVHDGMDYQKEFPWTPVKAAYFSPHSRTFLSPCFQEDGKGDRKEEEKHQCERDSSPTSDPQLRYMP